MLRSALVLAVMVLVAVAAPVAQAVPPPVPQGVQATATSNTSVRVTWSAVVGAVHYEVRRTREVNWRWNSIGTSTTTSFVDTPVGRGTWYYEVCAVNAAGERGCPRAWTPGVAVTLVGDQVPPTVSLTTPGDGERVAGVVRLAATASDDMQLSGVWFGVNGTVREFPESAPYESTWDTTLVPNGEYVVSAHARDWDGNTSKDEARVVVDNPLNASLAAAYGFEEPSGSAAADASGRGNTGTIAGATRAPTGRFGSALSFDGVNDRVDLPTLGDFYRRGFTLEAWVKKAGLKTDAAVVGSWASGTFGGPMIWVDHLTGRYVQALNKGSANYLDSGRTPRVGGWQHLATTYDRSTLRFYVDGVEVASRAFCCDAGATDLWRIGAYGPGPGGFFDGLIDEVRIHRRPLSAAEIAVDMATATAGGRAWTPPAAPQDVRAAGGVAEATVSWSAVDGADAYAVHRSTTPGFEPTAANRVARVRTTTFTDGALHEGTYYYRVVAEAPSGEAGPPSAEARADVTHDTTPPELERLAPGPGAAVSGLVHLKARATDEGIVHAVVFEVDGELLPVQAAASPAGADTYVLPWDSTTVANGVHRLVAVAADWKGNESRTEPITITVDNAAPASDLIAAYDFDDGPGTMAVDGSGRERHGAVQGGSAWTDAGKRGGALVFDGVDDSVTLPDLGQFFHDGFTFEAWVKKTGSKRDVGIVGSWSSAAGGGAMLWVDHQAGRYRLTTGRDPIGYLDSARTPAVGTWQHVAATYDGTTARFFVDGVEVASRAADVLGLGDTWRIGAYGPAALGFFDGVIDDVRIYSRPLLAGEIQADMDGAGDPVRDTTPPTAPAGLEATGATEGTIDLRWTAASDDVGVASYAVFVDGEQMGVATGLTLTIERLRCSRSYRVAVEARDGAGNASERVAIEASTADCRSAGLLAAYGFDKGAEDSSTNGNHGRVIDGIVVPGWYGNGLGFKTFYEPRMELPPLGTFYKHGFTLEAWVQGAQNWYDKGIVGSWIAAQGGGPLLWLDPAGRYRLTLGKNSSDYLDSGQSSSPGVWRHLAATYDGATARFYVDGELTASRPFTGNVGDSNTWRVGAYDNRKYSLPPVDEVRIYDRALSAAEIRSDMETPISP